MALNAEQVAAVERMNRATDEARAHGSRRASRHAQEKAAAEAGYPVSQPEMLGTANGTVVLETTRGHRHSVLGVMLRKSWLGKLIGH